METRFGSYISAIGTVGEFGPIVAVALLLTKKEPLLTSLLLLAFIVVAVATVLLAARAQPPRVVAMLGRHMESSAQLPVRVSLLFIVLLVLLAETLGLDVLLGRLRRRDRGPTVLGRAARSPPCGGSWRPSGSASSFRSSSWSAGSSSTPTCSSRTRAALWRVGLFLGLMLVARGLPVFLLYRKALQPSGAVPDGPALRHRAPAHRGDHQHRPGRGKDAPGQRGLAGGGRDAVGDAVPGHRAVALRKSGVTGTSATSTGRLSDRARPCPGARVVRPALSGRGAATENQSRASK